MINFLKKQDPVEVQKETAQLPNVQQLLMKVLVLGALMTLGISAYAVMVSNSAISAIIVMGAFGFLPIGIVVGGALVDKHLRCKVLKGMTKKNLGIVYFLSGSEYVSMIKNFDNDTIETKTKLFYLRKGKIYNEKDEAQSIIEPDKIKFQSGVPTMFFDVNNALPMSFHKEKTEIDPAVIAAITKAHIIIKEAESIGASKKQMAISVLVLVGIVGAAVYFAWQNNQLLSEQVVPALNALRAGVASTTVVG